MEKGNSLTVPIAIVFAGILIAGAVFLSNNNSGDPASLNSAIQNGEQNGTIRTEEIALNPVSSNDYIRGNPNAKVVLVEYSDTECPFCKKFHGTLKGLMDKFGQDSTLAWVYRNFPIKELHSFAPKESEAILCAGKIGGQAGFWDYTDRLYAITPSNNGLDQTKLPAIAKDVGLNETAFKTCLDSGEMATVVNADHADAVKSGGRGTPFSVLIASEEFSRPDVEKFLTESMLKYGFPPDLLAISEDNKKVSVAGAMPAEFLEELITILAK